MAKSFEEVAFALQPGELSDVVESDSGVHLIFRAETSTGDDFNLQPIK